MYSIFFCLSYGWVLLIASTRLCIVQQVDRQVAAFGSQFRDSVGAVADGI